MCRHPEYRTLFGAVSVSSRYEPLSRRILASALLNAASDPDLARLVRPRSCLGRTFFGSVGDEWKRLIIRDPDELSELVEDLEPDGKGLPVLLRQYLRLGGRLLGSSVDKRFSNVLDGLVVVDLLGTDRVLLERYLTKAGAEQFRRRHNLSSNVGAAACPVQPTGGPASPD